LVKIAYFGDDRQKSNHANSRSQRIERKATGRGLFLEEAESESKRLNTILTRFPPRAKSGQTDYRPVLLCRITPPNQKAADNLGVNWLEHETNI
jgi:hypothetical protein